MRTWIVGLVAAVVLAGLVGAAGAQQAVASGVYVRPDGSVMIDEWQGFTGGTMPMANAAVKMPSRVVFGLTVADDVVICREASTTSVCRRLGDLLPKPK